MTALLPLSIHLQGMAPASSTGWISLLTPTVSLLTGWWGRGHGTALQTTLWQSPSCPMYYISSLSKANSQNPIYLQLFCPCPVGVSPSYILLRIFSLTPILRKGSYFFLYAWKLNWLTQSMFLSPTEQAHKVGPHGEVQKKKKILRMSIPVLTFLVLLSSH
jgi:hypothetical protein